MGTLISIVSAVQSHLGRMGMGKAVHLPLQDTECLLMFSTNLLEVSVLLCSFFIWDISTMRVGKGCLFLEFYVLFSSCTWDGILLIQLSILTSCKKHLKFVNILIYTIHFMMFLLILNNLC